MWAIIAVFMILLALLAYLDTRKPKNYPPGPSWLPILGSALILHQLRRKTGYLYKATAELAKTYGPIIGLRIGKDNIVVVYGYESIKEMLSEDVFSGRPQGLFYETRTWGKRRGVLLTDEDFWYEQRRFVLRHLREFGFGKRSMSTLIEDEADVLVKTVLDRIGKESRVIEVRDLFGVPVLNTLWMMMANIRYSLDNTELKKLQSLLTDLFANIDMVGATFSHFPLLRYIAPGYSGYNFFLNIHAKVWMFLREELDRHNASYKEDMSRDFMDAYIQMLRSNDKSDSFTESQLLAICMDLFMAGSETTSKTLGFAFLYLVLYPEVQKKAQEEIDAVIGRDRAPQLSDRSKMPYVEAVVLESVRMFMGRTFSIPHRALRDTTLQGYFIPKDTMLIVNFNGVLMTQASWSDPDVFRPERFLREGRVHVPEHYLPFGFGRHRCLGETLAKANVFLFTASLLQRFKFEVPPGQTPPTTDCIDGVTPAPKPYEALVTLRN